MARVPRARGRWRPASRPSAPALSATHVLALAAGVLVGGLLPAIGAVGAAVVAAAAAVAVLAAGMLTGAASRSPRPERTPAPTPMPVPAPAPAPDAVRARGVDSSEAILVVDIEGRVQSLNPAAEALFGHASEEVIGEDVAVLMIPCVSSDEPVLVADRAGRPPLRQLPILGRDMLGLRADGSTFDLELSVVDVELGDRTVSTVVARDVSSRREAEAELAHRGTHDPLTGLPNRVLFLDRLQLALGRSARRRRPLAVLFCDLDRFKIVNDSLGHGAGDELLMAVAERFSKAVRAGDTVARFGGDEFVVLAEDLTGRDDATTVAQALGASLSSPISVGGQEIVVSASIGIAVGPDDDDTPETLLRDADAAMYRAKASGRSRHETFDAGLRRAAVIRLDTESALRRALRDDQLVVRYQPEINLETGTVTGVEALVRWKRGEDDLVLPSTFLPVAEETGLVVAIGEAVLHQACAQARRWHELLGDRAPTLWVNVSARQLAAADLVPRLAEAVTTYLPNAAALGIEITESDLVPDDENIQRAMFELTELGVGIAIDDFGTGFASLAYLWRFPADVVKIDQAFVRRLGEERDGTVIIASVIQLTRSLGKRTVAEGIETATQLSRLRRLGCDTGQGFLLGPPGPGEEIERLLTATARPAPTRPL